MRAYREGFSTGRNRRGLTQEELLHLMGSVDGAYAQRYSHATVSRWESGSTRPTLQRLQVFGKAVSLSPSETAGLILLAGLAPDHQTALDLVSADAVRETGIERDPVPSTDPGEIPNSAPRAPQMKGSSIIREAVKFLVLRGMGLGGCVVAVGYGFSLAGWHSGWMPLMYFGVIMALVLAQGFLLPGQARGLREFYWVSLFVILTTPFLQFAPLNLDPYNFSLIMDSYSSHVPYMLGLLVNIGLACGAGLMFSLLWNWQYSTSWGASNSLRRAAWVILPPSGIVYAAVVVISNISMSIQLAILVPTLAAVFVILLVLRDSEVVLTERDRRFFLASILTVATVSSSLGVITVIAIYVSPAVPMVLPNHNLLVSWEINYSVLGYTHEEALARVELGYIWHAMCLFAYMFFIIGGNVWAAIYRADRRYADRVTANTDIVVEHSAQTDASSEGGEPLVSSHPP